MLYLVFIKFCLTYQYFCMCKRLQRRPMFHVNTTAKAPGLMDSSALSILSDDLDQPLCTQVQACT